MELCEEKHKFIIMTDNKFWREFLDETQGSG